MALAGQIRRALSARGIAIRTRLGVASAAGSTRVRVGIALAAVPAVAGALLLAFQLLTPGTTTGGQTLISDAAPPVIYAKQLCSFANDDARAALIDGSDGGASVVVGDKTWWLFGDTLFLPESGKQIEQNSIAWSDTGDASGCPKLHYYAPNGVAQPFLPKDGSLTVWPAGAWAVDGHSFDFFTAYVYGSGPYAYWIGEVGLARLDTTTMQVTMLSRRLWDASSGFKDQVIGTSPVDVGEDGKLRLLLVTEHHTNLLARVDLALAADAASYEFWNGSAWTPSAADATPIWEPPADAGDIASLPTFENGASVAWNDALHKYVAVVNAGIDTIGARTADRLEGPWSAPQPWFDCRTIADARVPSCYSPFQHPQLAADGSRSVVATISRLSPYAVAAFDFRLGDAVHEYRSDSGTTYATTASSGGQDQGVAFYAADAPLDGFVAVYRWRHGDASRYATSSPGDGFARDGDAAFYAAPSASISGTSGTTYRAIYDWSLGDAHLLSPMATGLEQYGYTKGDVMFYAE